MKRKFAISALAGACVLLAAPAAQAQEIMISEVHNGLDAGNTDDYVELQMTADNQSTNTRVIRCEDAAGGLLCDIPIAGDPPNRQSQRTVLLGNAAVPGFDFSLGGGVITDSGNACWNLAANDVGGIDCVAWGAYTGDATTLSSPALPALASVLAPGTSIHRDISRGCPTALDAADDTNNSAADFKVGPPSPRNNSVAPTERLCGPAPQCANARTGTNGPDVLIGTNKKDSIDGLAGNDTITGKNGKDSLCGNDGDDNVSGGNAKDRLYGGNDNDTLSGGRGKDVMDGGPGFDVCNGGKGKDKAINCEAGTDAKKGKGPKPGKGPKK